MSEQLALEKQESVCVPLNAVLHGDCIGLMKTLPDNSFDLAIADPPYNVSKGGSWEWSADAKLAGFGGDWKKSWSNGTTCPFPVMSIFRWRGWAS